EHCLCKIHQHCCSIDGDTNEIEMKIRFLLLLTGLLASSGCTTVNTVENAQKEGQRQMVADQRVITDASLNRKVSIVGVNQTMTPTGLLKVQIEIANRTRSLQRFMYHFEWFDANGMQVDNVISASIPEQIEGMEDKFISSIAPNSSCKDFRVKFIEAN
ncbi:MAG: YcfL family protein, partial [Limisphaerales bacterium]